MLGGQAGEQRGCQEMAIDETDCEGTDVSAGREGKERGGGTGGGPRREQQPFFQCHVHHGLKVAPLTLKDSCED